MSQADIERAAAHIIAETLQGFDYEVADDDDPVEDAKCIIEALRGRGYVVTLVRAEEVHSA